ncbi:class I adenylate-forming enzyme family protein [Achromobacter sp. NPDC058515]|uniref:class I adenylate-forming enzyme family protein n=1 Tax=Achromobacter sp. NPDC058515 TaxID=3346533 RepID=UPI0036624405
MNGPADLHQSLHGLTVPGLLQRHALARPTALALSAPSHGGGRHRLTYGQVVLRMEAMARSLWIRGVRPGQRVALYLTNDAMREAVLTALGCYRLGAVVVPFNTRASPAETGDGLALVEPTHIVTTPDHAGRLARLWPAARVMELGSDVPAGRQWPDPETTHDQAELPPLPNAEQPSAMLFTSGTTGSPKAVVHCHRSQLYCGYAIAGAIGLTGHDIYQGAWPVYTSSVLNLACMGAWVAGAAVALEPASADNAQRLRLIESEGTTVYHGVPSVLGFLVKEYAKGGYDLGGVRRIGYGGAAMPADLVMRLDQLFPHADQIHIWGMTETGPAGSYLPPWLATRKPGCIGGPQAGCQLKVVDAAGAPAPQGEPGELLFHGPSSAKGYFRNAAATAETFVDGWVRTGDIARCDADGHLHFLDRKKDLINRGGTKIASVMVENVLHRFPGVIEAAVIAVPHPDLGEDIAACIATALPTPDIEALREYCRGQLADYQVPRHWYVFEQLPKNPMGKVLKRDLREMVRHMPEGGTGAPA